MPIKLHRDNFRWSNGRGHNQKPILVAHKKDTLGLGKQLHSTEQWWLNAFDSQLKSLDVSTSTATGEITVEQTQTNNPLAMSIKSRYYIQFVRGGLLRGELEEKVEDSEATATPGGTDDELKVKRSKEEKKAKKEQRKKRKASRDSEISSKDKKKEKKRKSKEKARNETDGEKKRKKRKTKTGDAETKEERRERKRLKRLVAKEMAALGM
ncbi:hypothetical protein EX30DRAFT_337754 [Ascodesmis nigricans]|uniref:G-patch domain-containing protein n=1 Tax=Ascodesmis nigricans TaxID=341454 RepID=A0A4S2N7T9_9PEZI|nr:hypothetical protein EX30DRAFT_337754 [Ascodesmis nigricans]